MNTHLTVLTAVAVLTLSSVPVAAVTFKVLLAEDKYEDVGKTTKLDLQAGFVSGAAAFDHWTSAQAQGMFATAKSGGVEALKLFKEGADNALAFAPPSILLIGDARK